MEAVSERFRNLSTSSRVENGSAIMFTDKYIQQRFPSRPCVVPKPQEQRSPARKDGVLKPATAPQAKRIRGSRSQFRQQQLPPKQRQHQQPFLLKTPPPPPPRASSQKRSRTWQQSIPCKSSPKQPLLLGRRHSYQAMPTVVKKPVHSSKQHQQQQRCSPVRPWQSHGEDLRITSVCSTPTDEDTRMVDCDRAVEISGSKQKRHSLTESVSAGPFPMSTHPSVPPRRHGYTNRKIQSMQLVKKRRNESLRESSKVRSAPAARKRIMLPSGRSGSLFPSARRKRSINSHTPSSCDDAFMGSMGESFSFDEDEAEEDIDEDGAFEDGACFNEEGEEEEELTDLEDGDGGLSGDESCTSTIADPLLSTAPRLPHTGGASDQTGVDDMPPWRASVFNGRHDSRPVRKSLSFPGTIVTSRIANETKPLSSKETEESTPPISRRILPLTTAACRPLDEKRVIPPATPPDLRGDIRATPPLTASLFPGRPPTIHFPLPHEKYTPLSPKQRALLKWKMSSITPNVVKSCIARVGFSRCSRGTAWMGYWGKHMKAEAFRDVRVYQKVNHFPGTFEIGRKDRLWRNLSRMQTRVGKKECDFVPLTYVLPQDLKQLRKDWDDGGPRQKWILKPPAAARGIGIKVIHRWGQVPKKRPVIVQRYVADPYLINGSKFDLRVYVYVPSYDPLKIYVFREGLARFATCKYSAAMKHLSNRFMHLTNYSINKRNADFTPNTDESVCQGHKWGLQALWRHMSSELGVDTATVWESIKELVVKTIVCSEASVSSLVKSCVKNSSSVHELFGFDIMLDRKLKPWILEVNISPSLHSNSQLDVNIKGRLMRDLLNIAGFTLPTQAMLDGEVASVSIPLTTDERIKHSHFLQKSLREAERERILDSLTPDDIRTLMLAEDELSRAGWFERVFPSANCGRYRRFFEMEKYYNTLLEQWHKKCSKNPRKGILTLQKLAALSRV